MGRAGTRFGRNVPLEHGRPRDRPGRSCGPNPRTVSRELLTRARVQPATHAQRARRRVAAVHDPRLVQPRQGRRGRPLGDPAGRRTTPGRSDPMIIPRTPRRTRRGRRTRDGSPPTFVNTETHWWDGSPDLRQHTARRSDAVRSGERRQAARLADGRLPLPDDPGIDPTPEPGFWLGPGAAGHAVRAASTTRSATGSQAELSGLVGRGAVRAARGWSTRR